METVEDIKEIINNREFAFRVWVKNAMHYITPSESSVIPNDGTYDVMQYTGQKDLKGMKIFEGDILDGSCKYSTEQGVVILDKYKDGEFYKDFHHYGYIIKCKREKICTLPDFEEVEIIGNIYENPELI